MNNPMIRYSREFIKRNKNEVESINIHIFWLEIIRFLRLSIPHVIGSNLDRPSRNGGRVLSVKVIPVKNKKI